MKKLLLTIAVGLFSIAMTDCMEQKASKAKTLENLTEKDLEGKSVEELNKLLYRVATEKSRVMGEERVQAIERALKLLDTNPDAMAQFSKQGSGLGSFLENELEKIERKNAKLGHIAELISAAKYKKEQKTKNI